MLGSYGETPQPCRAYGVSYIQTHFNMTVPTRKETVLVSAAKRALHSEPSIGADVYVLASCYGEDCFNHGKLDFHTWLVAIIRGADHQ